MFGTVARVSVQPGKESEFVAIGKQWTQERGEQTHQVAGFVFKLDEKPGDFMIVAVFRDRASYEANAQDPETDRWFRQMRETLAADPERHDGEVVEADILGGI